MVFRKRYPYGSARFLTVANPPGLAAVLFAVMRHVRIWRSATHTGESTHSTTKPSSHYGEVIMSYYYRKGNQVSGPFDLERLRGFLSHGTIDATTPVAAAADEDGPTTEIWGPIERVLPELFRKPESKCANSRSTNDATNEGTGRPPSTPVLFCAGIMVLAFFMPWVQFFGLEASGYALSKFGDEGKVAWLIPILAGLVVLVSLNGKDNRALGIAAGVLPILAAVIGIVKLMEEMGPDNAMQLLDFASGAVGIGVWLTLVTSIAIIIAASASDSQVIAAQVKVTETAREKLVPILAEIAPKPVTQPTPGISEEVARLADLHANGILTVEEFQAAKSRLLVHA